MQQTQKTVGIEDKAVTLVKLADIPTDTLVGNNTGSDGQPLTLTISEVNAMLGTGSGTVESVTGDGVDNTDPANPELTFPTPADIGADVAGAAATAQSNAESYADGVSSNASVIAKVLTAFAAGAGTVTATDSILSAFQKIVGNIALLVTGPSSAVDGNFAVYDGVTGKLIKDGGNLGSIIAGLTHQAAITTSDRMVFSWTISGGVPRYVSFGEMMTALNSGLAFISSFFKNNDTTLAGDSSNDVPTQHAVKTYIDNAVTGLLEFKGATNCSANPNYPAANKGDAYIVSVAGKIGGASGKSVDVGDMYLATADNAGGTEASVGTSWVVLEHNLVGALLATNNLSDLTNAGTARTNLGLAIGTDVQAHDADLDDIAALAPPDDDVMQRKGGHWVGRTIAQLVTDIRAVLDSVYQAALGFTPREVLTANRDYYVRTDGSDSNTGLANTSGAAFLTWQKAVNVACALDLGIYAVTIHVASGTYTGAVLLKPYVGVGPISIVGDVVTPSNVVLSVTSAVAIQTLTFAGKWKLSGFKVTTVTAGDGIYVDRGSVIEIAGLMEFGAIATNGDHFKVFTGGELIVSSNYTINGNARYHYDVRVGGVIIANSVTITLSGTPAFTGFLFMTELSDAEFIGDTFSGSATGQRYNIATSSVCNTNAGGATYLPGNTGGATATSGQYI